MTFSKPKPQNPPPSLSLALPEEPFAPLSLGSPLSPLRAESLGSLSQHHHYPPQQHQQLASDTPSQPPHNSESIVSPLGAGWPDSPTLGSRSPVSMLSPRPQPLRSDNDKPLPSAPEIPQTARLARGGTVHLQEYIPFQTTGTRFPPRKAVGTTEGRSRWGPEAGSEKEAERGSARPETMYLADHQPHRVAQSPTMQVARPQHRNRFSFHEGRSNETRFEDVEMRGGLGGIEDGGSGRDVARGKEAAEDVGPKNRNCLIGWTFAFALIILGLLFGLFFVKARKDGLSGA